MNPNDTIPGYDDLDIPESRAADPVKKCPSADRLIATIAQQYSVTFALAEAWLCERFGNRKVAA